MTISDVHTADKTDATVGHQNFAMVSQVDMEGRRQQFGWEETGNPHPLFPEQGPGPGSGIEFSNAVDKDPDLHTAHDRPGKPVNETPPRFIGLEDVCGQIERPFRLLNGL